MNKFWLWALVIVLVALGAWWYYGSGNNNANQNNNSTSTTSTSVVYSNTAYGISLTLPAEWQGYTVSTGSWSGQVFNKSGIVTKTDSGPQISISAPASANDLQPIPVMVFTQAQWSLILAGNNSTTSQYMAVGAAPVPPSKLGQNSKYVFAIPARYNYAFPQGYQQTDQIIQDSSRWSFFEPSS